MPKSAHARKRSEALVALMFLAPFLIVYLLFRIYPLGLGVWMSLHDWELIGSYRAFIGLENYRRLFSDPLFLRSVLNTVLFVLMLVPAFIVAGIGLAIPLNRETRFHATMRSVFFFSSVLSVTIMTLIWGRVLAPSQGLLNAILDLLGLPNISPLTDPNLALPAIAWTTLWWKIGLPMMIFLAALQQIPQEVYEAAKLDNASRWTTLRFITIPSLRRSIVLVAVIEIVKQFQFFGQAQLLTAGGPDNATRSVVHHMYEVGFNNWQVGYASSTALVLFVLILLGALLQAQLTRRWGRE